MVGLFWLSDAQWAVMEPFMPRNQPGARRVDDRRTISGIVHVIRSGCPWQDWLPVAGLPAGLRSANDYLQSIQQLVAAGLWRDMLVALAQAGWVGIRPAQAALRIGMR